MPESNSLKAGSDPAIRDVGNSPSHLRIISVQAAGERQSNGNLNGETYAQTYQKALAVWKLFAELTKDQNMLAQMPGRL